MTISAADFELLLQSNRILSSKLDIGEVLQAVMELATQVVRAEASSLLVELIPDPCRCWAVAERGDEEDYLYQPVLSSLAKAVLSVLRIGCSDEVIGRPGGSAASAS